MNPIYVAAILSLALFANAYDDGQWRGEGLLASQDWASRGIIGSPLALSASPLGLSSGVINGGLISAGVLNNGLVGVPGVIGGGVVSAHGLIGGGLVGASGVIGGGLVGVPGVINGGLGLGRGLWAHGGAPIGVDGRVVDTPDVVVAKAAHRAARINVAHGINAW